MTTLLVAGAERVDAGKTTFSTGLISFLREAGAGAVGVKPRAGNDYWYDYDDYRLAAGDGRLYGKDARRLAAAGGGGLPAGGNDGPGEPGVQETPGSADGSAIDAPDSRPEAINPLHRLWRPTPGRTGLLGEADRTFLVDRIGTGPEPLYVVNGRAESEGIVPDDITEGLPLADAPRVHDLAGFNDLMADHHVDALDQFSRRIQAGAGPVVVESYGDVAAPVAVEPDAVAVVAPGRARIYDGGRYAKARSVASGSAREGSLEERTGRVTGMLDPVAEIGLPALPGDARGSPGSVADAYRAAYAALVDAA